jgi:alkanesulfonate monooxygenase SsuD/methylene tetrahydromethanopterin reductase-like flavin-dependent oxidoreductase (luciferase family)
MDVGVFVQLGNGNANPEILRALGPAVEERGFESIWVAEHVVLFDEYESSYPYSPDGRFPGGGDTNARTARRLAFLAAVTDQIAAGTAICLIPSATRSTRRR